MHLQDLGRLFVVSCKLCRGLDGSEDSGERRRFVPASAANAEWANRVFGQVVRDGPVAVLGIADQLRPLRAQVSQSLAEQAFRYEAERLLKHQRVDGVQHACTVASSQS